MSLLHRIWLGLVIQNWIQGSRLYKIGSLHLNITVRIKLNHVPSSLLHLNSIPAFQQHTHPYYQFIQYIPNSANMTTSSPIIRTHCDLSLNQLRHSAAFALIQAKAVTRLLDVGCSQGEFLRLAARSPRLQLLAGLDIQEQALSQAVQNSLPEPLQTSIQYDRTADLRVRVYKGDLLQPHPELRELDFQLVTLIEVIEHLPPANIRQASQTIFGYLRPLHVVVTTPNREFNDHFEGGRDRLRHWDHKFEWTRQQFTQYCQSVAEDYGYDFHIQGIGEHVTDSSKGCCTQMALFQLKALSPNSHAPPCLSPLTECKLELRQEYLIPSWQSQLENILLSLFYDGLNDKQQQSFQALAEHIKECSPLARCLEQSNIPLDSSFLLQHIQKHQEVFQWDSQGYQLCDYVESEEEINWREAAVSYDVESSYSEIGFQLE